MIRSLYLVLTMEGYQAQGDLTGHSVVQNTLYGREGPAGLDLFMAIYWSKGE